MDKKFNSFFFVFLGAALVAGFVLAAAFVSAEEYSVNNITSGTAEAITPNIVNVLEKDLKQELSIKENVGKGRVVCLAIGICPPSPVNATEVLMKATKVTEVGADYLKVSIFGYSYKIDTAAAKLVRHYWGESSIDEFSVGDIANVHGYLDETNNYLVHAKTVRNVSIQKVHNVFKGVIENISSSGASSTGSFVMITKERGNQTVYVSTDTKIVLEGWQQIICIKAPCPLFPIPASKIGSFSDLKVGDEVVVRGLWDKTLSTIRAQSIVVGGEFSLKPFFKEEGEKLKERILKYDDGGLIEHKIEEKLEKSFEKLEHPGKKEGILKQIEELSKKLFELRKKTEQ